MKKMIALLLALMLSLSLLVPVFAEETEPVAALEAFNKATEELVGCDYEPVALLGSQVVAGTNYCLLCKCTVVTPDAPVSYVLMYIYSGVDGTNEVLDIQDITLGVN